jgi:hypothetical protein
LIGFLQPKKHLLLLVELLRAQRLLDRGLSMVMMLREKLFLLQHRQQGSLAFSIKLVVLVIVETALSRRDWLYLIASSSSHGIWLCTHRCSLSLAGMAFASSTSTRIRSRTSVSVFSLASHPRIIRVGI